MDGTRSKRRSARERSAFWKMRADLHGIFLILVLALNGGVYFVHTAVIPIPLGIDALRSFDTNASTWKQKIRDNSIVDRYTAWQQQNPGRTQAEIEQRMREIWAAFPAIAVFMVCVLLASWRLIRWCYLASLQELAAGIYLRKEQNTELDLGRMREEESLQAS